MKYGKKKSGTDCPHRNVSKVKRQSAGHTTRSQTSKPKKQY